MRGEREGKREREREVREEKEEGTQNHKPLNPLVLSRTLSYLLNPHSLNQQDRSQFKHLIPKTSPLLPPTLLTNQNTS